jgi:hypothetical protein
MSTTTDKALLIVRDGGAFQNVCNFLFQRVNGGLNPSTSNEEAFNFYLGEINTSITALESALSTFKQTVTTIINQPAP